VCADGAGNCSAFRGRSAKPPQLRFRGLGTPVLPQESTQFPTPSKKIFVTELKGSKKNKLKKQHIFYTNNWLYKRWFFKNFIINFQFVIQGSRKFCPSSIEIDLNMSKNE